MRPAVRILAVSAALIAALAPATAQPAAVPVKYGGHAPLDACSSLGQVTGLNPKGDNFLSVRAGPSAGHARIDKLHTGDQMFICDERPGWFGVVYGGENCGNDATIAKPRPYPGPCKSGWISRQFVDVIAADVRAGNAHPPRSGAMRDAPHGVHEKGRHCRREDRGSAHGRSRLRMTNG